MKPLHLSGLIAVAALVSLAGCVTTGHPCFSERVMYPDQSAACQYGRSYRCDNGDWIASRQACSDNPSALAPMALSGSCEFDGISYASGSASCNSGTQYRCENGIWSNLDLPCAAGDAPYPYPAAITRGATCSYGGATVASSSAICQSGTTFLCNDGRWFNLRTTCR